VRQKDMQLYLDLGEYRRGENTDNDAAFDRKDQMEAFLQQRMTVKTGMQDCLEMLYGSVA
jgi:type III secretion protein N (ATPase)